MKISDLLKMGLRNLTRRKARTALTVLGMVIGTISIVVMFSIGIGINKSFNDAIMENGTMTMINISSRNYEEDENGNVNRKEQQLNDDLIRQIKDIKHVKAVSPVYQLDIPMECGKYERYGWGMAMDSSTFKEFGFPPVEEGTSCEEDKESILFGKEMLTFRKFGMNSVKEKEVNLGRDKVTFKFQDYQTDEKKKEVEFRVKKYGILRDDGNFGDYRYMVLMDIDYYKELYTKYANTLKIEDRKKALKSLDTYSEIMINVDNMKNVMDVQTKIEEMGFKTSSQMEYMNSSIETANMLQIVLGAIGAVAMLVSAINIANTMIMSIYERTKEIGIMKVLGCYIRDIKKLFLFEAGMLGFIGGVIGVGISYLASWAVNKYGGTMLAGLMPGGGYYYGTENASSQFSYIPFWLPFLAAFFAVVVGVISGYIPARRATKISAIEAMKTES